MSAKKNLGPLELILPTRKKFDKISLCFGMKKNNTVTLETEIG